MKKSFQRSAIQTAIKILSYREHSRYELETKLRNKGFCGEEIDETVARLVQNDFLSDRRYAEAMVRHLATRKRKGRVSIVSALHAAKVDETIIHDVMEDFSEKYDELSLAIEAGMRKLSTLRGDDSKKKKEKLFRHLKSRGYTNETIFTVLEKLEQSS